MGAMVDGVDIECVKAAVYALGTLCEVDDVKAKLVELGAVASVVNQCAKGDIETKRSCGYLLARLSENIEFHDDMVRNDALQAVITLASLEDMECQEYSAFSLAHLADNFENHVAIAKEGGIQALLRLGRTRTTDDELQYKAALTVGNLAANAVKLLPKGVNGQAVSGEIGFAAQQMMAKKTEVAAKRGREKTEGFLERAGVNDGAADAGL